MIYFIYWLLNKLSKILSFKRIISLATTAEIISRPNRPNHSTIHQVHRVVDIIYLYLENKKYVLVISTDNTEYDSTLQALCDYISKWGAE